MATVFYAPFSLRYIEVRSNLVEHCPSLEQSLGGPLRVRADDKTNEPLLVLSLGDWSVPVTYLFPDAVFVRVCILYAGARGVIFAGRNCPCPAD